jgi:ribonucleoside-diphosphate reductase beta chain
MFEDIATIKEKTDFVVNNSRKLRRDIDLTRTETSRPLPRTSFSLVNVWKELSSMVSLEWC